MLISRALRLALAAAIGLIVASTTPALASAAQRYASPGGSGSDCRSTKPCGLVDAVGNAAAGDEVIVEPGDYALTSNLVTPDKITIHGVAGKPRPRLLISGVGQSCVLVEFGSTLRYVEIDQAPGSGAQTLDVRDYSLVDQVIARASGWGITASTRNSVIKNSVLVASGKGGVALLNATLKSHNVSTLRNVTAIASGSGGVAIEDETYFPEGNATAYLTNVIASGSIALEAETTSGGEYATIVAKNSNYQGQVTVGTRAAVLDVGGNQSFPPPVFRNPAAGDFRQAPGSPTIGAGRDDAANGAFDVDGDPRKIGTTDIGADEFVPAPAAGTGAVSAVTTTSAKLTGSVAANGAPTTYRFQYGRTAAYASVTPTTAAGTGAVAAALTGLRPATTYHHRLVATNAGGTTTGADRTFTTVTPPTPAPFAGVRLLRTSLTYRHRAIALELDCPAATIGACTGQAKLTAGNVRLGRTSFAIAAGQQAKVKLRVSRAGRRLLQRVHRLRANEISTAHDAAGQPHTTIAKVTIHH